MPIGKYEKIQFTDDKREGFISKEDIIKDKVLRETRIIDTDLFKIRFIIFHVQSICNEYGLSYEELLLIVYLKELVVFESMVTVIDNSFKIAILAKYGFCEPYSETGFKRYSKGRYKLSRKGLEVADKFIISINNVDEYLLENRMGDEELNLERSLKGFLSGYF
jgi:hypothetical protein